MEQHSSTTSPKHPVEQGVTSMRSICREGLATREAIRVPRDVAEDILGKPYSGTFADDQVIRVTLATDPGCPGWIRESRESFHDQQALVLLGPVLEEPDTSTSSNQAFAAGVAYGLRSAVRELDDGGVAEIERQAEIMEARAEGKPVDVAPMTSSAPAAGNVLAVDDIEGTLLRCRSLLAFASQAMTDRAESPNASIEDAEHGMAMLLDQVNEGLRDAAAQVSEQRVRRSA
jgi:hypothetical protein